jgi:small subunit ribosomal protein S3
MGRKVHPVGFRLGIIKDWQAHWFAPKGKYGNQLQQDLALRKIVFAEAPKAAIARVEIERSPSSVTLTIWTAKPGILIAGNRDLLRRDRKSTRLNSSHDV